MAKKRRYPIHRRPPVSHNVKSHTRDGHPVGSYSRGSGGTRTYPISRSSGNAEAFTVTLKYKDKSSEIVNVFAPKGDYKKALDEALEERTHEEKPLEVNILDPSLGEVIGFIRKGIGTGLQYVKGGIVRASPGVKAGLRRGARGLGKGLRRGAKEVGKGARAGVRSVGASVQVSLQNAEAKRLVRHSYDEDPGKRALARTKLKKKYPEVYDNCDFSTRATRTEISKKKKKKKKKKSLTETLLGSKKKKRKKKKKTKKK